MQKNATPWIFTLSLWKESICFSYQLSNLPSLKSNLVVLPFHPNLISSYLTSLLSLDNTIIHYSPTNYCLLSPWFYPTQLFKMSWKLRSISKWHRELHFKLESLKCNLKYEHKYNPLEICSFNCFMQQISTLAGNQVPSYYEWEVLFTMGIIGLGLLLFALLIGNMQNFLQALGRR